jgi:organic radical activating enzyme
MKERFLAWKEHFFKPILPIEPGIYSYQTPPEAPKQYRLHLRIEPGGEGTLILNARTLLHLNQTATEYAYHLVKQSPPNSAAKIIQRRYKVSLTHAQNDYNQIAQNIHTLIDTPELAPDTYFDFERVEPYSKDAIAPYRLDCALTYQCGDGSKNKNAPIERVKRELSDEDWITILQKAWKAGIPHVVFTGGEPTLRPDLIDLITEAERLGQVSGLLTDGLRLTDPKYLQALLNSGLDHVMLMLDPENMNSWEALRDIHAVDIFETVHLTITKRNKEKLDSIVEELAKINVNSVSLSVDDIALKHELLAMQKNIADHRLTLVWDLPVPYSNFHPVALELAEHQDVHKGAGKAWLYIEPDGDVLPEQGIPKVLGNFLTDSWDVIKQAAKKL